MTDTSIAVWLTVSDGAAAVDFYQRALAAEVVERLTGDDGSVQVARLRVGAATVWLQQEDGSAGAGTVRMIVSVDDPDQWYGRAIGAGADEVSPVHEGHGWRTGRVRDPFGHDWEFSRELT